MDRIKLVCVAAATALILGACGGDDSDEPDRAEEIARAKEEGRREAAAEQRSKEAADEAKRLRREVAKLRREDRQRGRDRSGEAPAPAPSSPSTACGDGVSVNRVTSCSFGRNVKGEYESSGGASVIAVHSPVTGRTYTMRCGGGIPVVCVGGNNATVYIR